MVRARHEVNVVLLDRVFLPFVVVSTAYILALWAVVEDFPFELVIGSLGLVIAVRTAHTATVANERRERLDRRDRVIPAYRACINMLAPMADPDDVPDLLPHFDHYNELSLALDATMELLELPETERLLTELYRWQSGASWKSLEVRRYLLGALSELGALIR